MIRYLRSFDLLLIGSAMSLFIFGLATTFFTAQDNQIIQLQLIKQISFGVLGVLIFFFLASFDLRFLRTRSVWVMFIYIVGIISLLGVLLVGIKVRGASSWFHIGPFTIEPVEFVKISIILLLSKYFSFRHAELQQFRHVFISGIYVGIPVVIALLQPDLGAAVVLFSIWFGILLLLELPKKQLIFLSACGLFVFLLGWFAFLAPYQKGRLTSFAAANDPQGGGYHTRQAMIAIGSGGLLGKKISEPTQASQNFLPESTTDFIFAASTERFGLVGATAILFGFMILFWRILRIAYFASNNFIRSVAAGCALLFFAHTTIHIGMNLGLLPVTGLPLPFVSYGGSHIIAGFIILGIMESLRRHQAQLQLDPSYSDSFES
ncbi:MAG: hypothetical protein A3A97_04090 [Candidatus Terrybacteria bacterium RIFCSPLOWO2_01_FULL_40_23]|uniref:Rod shape-determining protein RodA n=1 Tax=Candidatus Terrybacteria bacterium RIFCSPLOWO2_01_FULL_40_23 TaxID=1802366 RepID=A0A1G2PXB7_9BACT|nr:MAG: hypothetical protein A3A97_04090 [Candidatus Terrybacteria bacterium RIFCSPLOWO2_01_FULL_40_23]